MRSKTRGARSLVALVVAAAAITTPVGSSEQAFASTAGRSLSGTVSAAEPGGSVAHICVVVTTGPTLSDYVSRTCAEADAGSRFAWELTGLASDEYRILYLNDDPAGTRAPRFHDGDLQDGAVIDATTGDVTGIDDTLTEGRSITGTLDVAGDAIGEDVCIQLDTPGDDVAQLIEFWHIDLCLDEPAGPIGYAFNGLPAIDGYTLWAQSASEAIPDVYWNDATQNDADPINLATSNATNINLTLGGPAPPHAPVDVSATAGNGQATIDWTAPRTGAPPTAYLVTVSPETGVSGTTTRRVEAPTTSLVFDGLTNGVEYVFTIRATNDQGIGPSSDPTEPVTPRRSSTSGSGGGGGGGGSTPSTTTTSTTVAGSTTESEGIAGTDRTATAIAASRDTFADAASTKDELALRASTVVLARSDGYADALAGTPLAAERVGPLLLTSGEALDDRVRAEIDRVLGGDGTVVLLGGTAALSPQVAAALDDAGYGVERIAGDTRYSTAVAVARALGAPSPLIEVTGHDFPDALAAGAAAASIGGAILLTDGDRQAPATQDYLSSRPGVPRFAVGGPAAAADPSAARIVGPDRYTTAIAVAERFFSSTASVGLSSGTAYPDALAGGAHISFRRGPLLLTPRSPLDPRVRAFLEARRDAIGTGFIYGGTAAIATETRSAFEAAIR